VVIGFNTDTTYAEGDNSWVADLAECYAEVYKTPHQLFFDPDDPQTMDWETEMELNIGDVVWFSIMESKNAFEVICENNLYKSVPYADCYVCKRDIPTPDGRDATITIPLNGYVLCKPVYLPKLSHLDALSEDQIDKSRGTIAFIGNAPKRYLREEYCHIDDLRVGDEVVFDPKTPLFLLERTKSLTKFNGDNLYWVCQRRRISLVLNR
jgi:hypothetical protein